LNHEWTRINTNCFCPKDARVLNGRLLFSVRKMSHQPDNIFAGTQVVSLVGTTLRERSDYETVNRFLIKARREMVRC
jgi:hypothetical protein